MMDHYIIFATLCSLLCIAYSAPTAKPNIVFILADDYGFNDIGYHAKKHNSAMKTPFLDSLAEKGIKLENYYVQPICTPTRSQLLSGRYQIHTGLQHEIIWVNQPKALPLNNTLLPEQLRHCGYDTHMVGKWHLGFFKNEYLPWKRGFNSYYGFLSGSVDYYTRYRCYEGECGVDMWHSERGPVNNTWGEYSTHLFGRKAIEAIDKRDSSKPLFLYLAYQSVHSPMQVPEKYIKPFGHIKDKTRRTYAGMIAAMDESIANVTNHLDKVGLLNNTIIIFSTDNGGQTIYGGNNWPLRGRKGTLWEGGVKGVGFIYGEPLGMRGSIYNGLIHVSDWFPTLLEASNCPVLGKTLPLDGFSQWSAIRQKEPSPRIEILHNIDPEFSQLHKVANNGEFNTSIHAAIRTGPWKLLTGDPGFSEWVEPPEHVQNDAASKTMTNYNTSLTDKNIKLFNIDTDPYEYNNLASAFPHVVSDLLARLSAYQATAVPEWNPPHDPKSDPKFHGGFWGPWIDE